MKLIGCLILLLAVLLTVPHVDGQSCSITRMQAVIPYGVPAGSRFSVTTYVTMACFSDNVKKIRVYVTDDFTGAVLSDVTVDRVGQRMTVENVVPARNQTGQWQIGVWVHAIGVQTTGEVGMSQWVHVYQPSYYNYTQPCPDLSGCGDHGN